MKLLGIATSGDDAVFQIYALTSYLFYIIIIISINLELLDNTFDYKSIHIKFAL